MRRSAIGSVIAFILVLGLIGLGGYAVWNAGYQQGLVEVAESTADVVVTTPYYPGFFGLGFFGIFLAFLLFGLIAKLLFFRRHWRGGPGYWGKGWQGSEGHEEFRTRMEQRMTDWHDEAHGSGRRPDPSDG